MLVLNFMYMKKSLFRFSSRRILFSTVIASALIAGGSQAVFADAGEVQVVLQTGTIKGKIVDSNGEPVIGANVMVKGTTNGCMTDIDGNFSLKDAKGTLVISYIGYLCHRLWWKAIPEIPSAETFCIALHPGKAILSYVPISQNPCPMLPYLLKHDW